MANPPDNNPGNSDGSTDFGDSNSSDPNVGAPPGPPPTDAPGWVWWEVYGGWWNTITKNFWRRPLGQENNPDAPYSKVEYSGAPHEQPPGDSAQNECAKKVMDLYYWNMREPIGSGLTGNQADWNPLSPLFNPDQTPPIWSGMPFPNTDGNSMMLAWVSCKRQITYPDLGPRSPCNIDITSCTDEPDAVGNYPYHGMVKQMWECSNCDTWFTCDSCCAEDATRTKFREMYDYEAMYSWLERWFGEGGLCDDIVNNLADWKTALEMMDPSNPKNDRNSDWLPYPYGSANSVVAPFPWLGGSTEDNWNWWWRGWRDNIVNNALAGDTDICRQWHDKLTEHHKKKEEKDKERNKKIEKDCYCRCKECALKYGFCKNAAAATKCPGSGSGGSGSDGCVENVGLARFLATKSLSALPAFYPANQPNVSTSYPYALGLSNLSRLIKPLV
jgi:hypothetical protein